MRKIIVGLCVAVVLTLGAGCSNTVSVEDNGDGTCTHSKTRHALGFKIERQESFVNCD